MNGEPEARSQEIFRPIVPVIAVEPTVVIAEGMIDAMRAAIVRRPLFLGPPGFKEEVRRDRFIAILGGGR